MEATYRDNPDKQRYEALIDNTVIAFSEYRPVLQSLMLTHTEVNQDLEGKGIGGNLVKFALEDIRNQNLTVIPLCPFVKTYLKRHPEYLDTVHPEHRKAFQL